MSKQFIFVNTDGDYEESVGAFEIADHIVSSAGVADASKPIITDASGKIDSSLIDFGTIDHGALSGLADDDHLQYIRVDGTRAFTGEQSMGGFKLTSLADPTAAQDATTKAYVDSVAVGLRPKGNVAVATTANITLSGLQTIDGYTTLAGDRVLVKDQTNQTENGIYVAAAGVWTRSEDQDNNPLAEIVNGVFVPDVLNGTANAGQPFYISSVGTGTDGVHQIGVDNIVWDLFTSPTQLQAGDGIEFVGNVVNADLLASGGLKFVSAELAVEPADFAGNGLVDDGADNLEIDFATVFTIDGADNKAVQASDYASTANGEGASRVGIEDSAAYYSGNEVEAALSEVSTQLGGDTSSTFNFTEDNVLADNDAVYAALDKLDLRFGDLSSTANGEGASIIGVEDAGGFFAGTDVESALQELGADVAVPGIEVTVDGAGVSKGDLIYFSANDTISSLNTLSTNVNAIGLAAEDGIAAATIKVANDQTVLTSVITGATAGDKYYWDGSALSATQPSGSGSYVWQVGYAKNATDLYVDVLKIKKNA